MQMVFNLIGMDSVSVISYAFVVEAETEDEIVGKGLRLVKTMNPDIESFDISLGTLDPFEIEDILVED